MTIRDRLPELQAAHYRKFSIGDESTPPPDGALDFGYQLLKECEYLEEFLNEANNLRAIVTKMSDHVEEVKKKHSHLLAAPRSDEKTQKELENLMTEIQEMAKNVQKRLKFFEQIVEREENANRTSAELRIRKMQHSTILHSFVDIMIEYNRSQVDYRERCKHRFQRQLELTGRTTTDEELEDMLEKKDPIIFTKDICIAGSPEQGRRTLADIQARHDDIMKLERAILELHTVFRDMAVLVNSQGDMIDRIEHSVMGAVDYVSVAKYKTKKAIVYQSKARKKVIIIVIVVGLLLLIVILVVTLNVGRTP